MHLDAPSEAVLDLLDGLGEDDDEGAAVLAVPRAAPGVLGVLDAGFEGSLEDADEEGRGGELEGRDGERDEKGGEEVVELGEERVGRVLG